MTDCDKGFHRHCESKIAEKANGNRVHDTLLPSAVCPAGLSDIVFMGLIRPATPGFLVTLAAAVLLAIVSFSVPYFKSIFFLKASLSNQGINGSVTFGTLGYCVELPNGTTCSKPKVGYELGTPHHLR